MWSSTCRAIRDRSTPSVSVPRRHACCQPQAQCLFFPHWTGVELHLKIWTKSMDNHTKYYKINVSWPSCKAIWQNKNRLGVTVWLPFMDPKQAMQLHGFGISKLVKNWCVSGAIAGCQVSNKIYVEHHLLVDHFAIGSIGKPFFHFFHTRISGSHNFFWRGCLVEWFWMLIRFKPVILVGVNHLFLFWDWFDRYCSIDNVTNWQITLKGYHGFLCAKKVSRWPTKSWGYLANTAPNWELFGGKHFFGWRYWQCSCVERI